MFPLCTSVTDLRWLSSAYWTDDERTKILDGLELACYVAEAGVSCSNFDPSVLPIVRTPHDLVGVRRYLECAAETWHRTRAAPWGTTG